MFRIWAFCLLLFVGSVSAHATTMVALDVREQAEESHGFVDAVVGEATVVVTERMVYTDTELFVNAVVAGESPQRIVVRQAGGVLEGRTVFLAGDARLVKGQRILAFVRHRDGLSFFTALGQSVWHVTGPEEQLHQDVESSHLLERADDGRIVPPTQSPRYYGTATELTNEVVLHRFGGAL